MVIVGRLLLWGAYWKRRGSRSTMGTGRGRKANPDKPAHGVEGGAPAGRSPDSWIIWGQWGQIVRRLRSCATFPILWRTNRTARLSLWRSEAGAILPLESN